MKTKKLPYLQLLLVASFFSLMTSCSYEKTDFDLKSLFTPTWEFSEPASLSFDQNYVEIIDGTIQLKPLNLKHSHNDFALGTHVSTENPGLSLTHRLSQSLAIDQIFPDKTNNLVAYWRAENNWNDSTLKSQNPGLNDITFSATSQLGSYSASFNNTSSRITLADKDDFDLNLQSNFSISLWYYTNQLGEQDRILSKACHDGSSWLNSSFLLTKHSTDVIQFSIFPDGVTKTDVGSSTPIVANKWAHIVITYDTPTVKLFIDGVLQGQSTIAPMFNSTQDLVLGTRKAGVGCSVYSGQYINGMLDEVAIFNTTLLDEEALEITRQQALHHTELSSSWTPQWDDLIGYWKMDGSWQDSSGNANHGSAVGDSTFSSSTTKKIGTLSGSFDGTGDYISLLSHSADANLSAGTISAWVKPTTLQSQAIFDIYGDGTNYIRLLFSTVDDTVRAVFQGNATWKAATYDWNEMNINSWTFLTMTWSLADDELKIYQNGQLMDEASGLAAFSIAATDMRIAQTGNAVNDYIGAIDDLSLWETALDTKSILAIYNWQKQKYSGRYDSVIVDKGNEQAPWPQLNWSTSLPFGKEIVGDQDNSGTPEIESLTDYPSLATNLGSGLVGLWHLNESTWTGAPGDIKDSSGLGNHGQSFGSSPITLGKLGTAANLTNIGSGTDYIEIPNSPSLENIQEQPYTISAWYKPREFPVSVPPAYDSAQGIVIKPGFHIGMYYDAGKIFRCFLWTDNGGPAGYSVFSLPREPGEYYHVVCSFDTASGELKVYVDGKMESSQNYTPTTIYEHGVNPWKIGIAASGTPSYGWPARGDIDEVAIWSRILTDVEIQQLYRRSANRVQLQVKSCVDPACICEKYNVSPPGNALDCDGDTVLNTVDNEDAFKAEFKGPGGDLTTYYSELFNRKSSDLTFNCGLNNSDDDSNVCVNDEMFFSSEPQFFSPQISYSHFPLSAKPIDNPYFQYRVFLQADENLTCSGSPCLPSFNSINLNSNEVETFYGKVQEIKPKNFITYTQLKSATVIADSCATFQLSSDENNYYYWDGDSWAIASLPSQMSSKSEVEQNIASFGQQQGPGKLYVKIFLTTNESQTSNCTVKEIDIDYSR